MSLSPGQFFVTILDIHLAQDMAVQARVENIPIFEMIKDPSRKGLFEGNIRIGPVLEVKITKHFDRHGIFQSRSVPRKNTEHNFGQ